MLREPCQPGVIVLSVSGHPVLPLNLHDLFYLRASLVRMKLSSATDRPIQHVGSGPSFLLIAGTLLYSTQ